MNYFALGLQTFLYNDSSQRRSHWGSEYIKPALGNIAMHLVISQAPTAYLPPFTHPWHPEAPLRSLVPYSPE